MSLKLNKLQNRETAKITFTANAELKSALQDYAEIYRQTYGGKETVAGSYSIHSGIVHQRRSRIQTGTQRSHQLAPIFIKQSGKRDINHGYYWKFYTKQRWLQRHNSYNDHQCEGEDCHQ